MKYELWLAEGYKALDRRPEMRAENAAPILCPDFCPLNSALFRQTHLPSRE